MYFVIRIFFDFTDAEQHSVQIYTDKVQALKRYYSIIANDIDKEIYKYEMVSVINQAGTAIAQQIFERETQDI